MTVAELIAALQALPDQDAVVVVWNDALGWDVVTDVDLDGRYAQIV